ncbi:MAG: peptidoglycan DD-metalloendopeptidase family protein [Eubacteriaceae bacterium]|jgi:murein DD-endopeptidase MepM/ murein hydrolase activator NlpD/peptidoglycan hydrolase CwlO-like protein
MKHTSKKRKLILILAIVMIFALTAPVLASTTEELKDQITQSQSNIDDANYQIDMSQNTIDGIEQELVKANEEIDKLQEQRKTLEKQLSAKQTEIDSLQKDLDAANKKEDEQKEALSERIRTMYMYSSDNGYMDIVFSGDSFADVVTQLDMSSKIMEADKQMLDEYEQNAATISKKVKALEDAQAEVKSKTASIDAKIEEAQNIADQKQSLIDQNQSLIADAKVQIREEESSISAANQNIQDIAAKAEAEALSKQREEAKQKEQQAQDAKKQAAQLVTDAKADSNNAQTLVNKVQESADKTTESADKAIADAQSAQKTDTAAQAVEANNTADTSLTETLQNVADTQKQYTTLATDKAKQAADAQDKADAEAQKKKDEEAQAAADAAKKAAEEEAQKQADAEAAQKAAEEAAQQQAQAEAQASAKTWSNGYSSTGWYWPLDGIYDITSLFGYRIHPIFGTGSGHEGLDIGASSGTPIKSCGDGTVILAGENGGYGNCVIIQQDNGYQVYYGHQSAIAVSEGQRVAQGDVIGYVGSTGWSTGPHLHLGVLSGGEFVDPMNFYPELG